MILGVPQVLQGHPVELALVDVRHLVKQTFNYPILALFDVRHLLKHTFSYPILALLDVRQLGKQPFNYPIRALVDVRHLGKTFSYLIPGQSRKYDEIIKRKRFIEISYIIIKAHTRRLNMELDLQSLCGLHVYSCTHWLTPNNHPPPEFGPQGADPRPLSLA